MYSEENASVRAESVSTGYSCRNKRIGTRNRRPVVPPVTLGNDAHLKKVWWNYWEARSWQQRHQVACWRSQVVALQYENQMLHEYIKTLLTGSPENVPLEVPLAFDEPLSSPTPSQRSKRNRKRRNRRKRKARNKDQLSTESDDSEMDSDVDEELLNYVEQTIRHRFERDNHPLLEKNKDKTGDQKVDAETLLQPPEMLARNRLEQMRELFGPSAPKLLAMETAVELTFNSNCDRHHPLLWPVVPLAAQAE